MNYLYNGVELPDINEVWTDKEKYPYAYIESDYPGLYAILLTNTPVKYVNGSYLVANTSYSCWMSDGVSFEFYQEETVDADGAFTNDSTPIWSNTDILNTDGTTYLAASEPIPVGGEPEKPTTFTPDPISMTMGWLVGRRIAGQRGKKVEQSAEPIAYLYPSVVLPDIESVWTPELKAQYPYAVIAHDTAQDVYALSVSNQPWYRQFDDAVTYTEGEGVTFVLNLAVASDWTSWSDFVDSFYDEDQPTIWTNNDIADYDDATAVYLSAFTPVPTSDGMVCYKGAVLPETPKVDGFGYALIKDLPDEGCAQLHLTNFPVFESGGYLYPVDISALGSGDAIGGYQLYYYDYGYPEDGWVFTEEDEGASVGDSDNITWTSSDVKSVNATDGSITGIYFAASEPVPVYE